MDAILLNEIKNLILPILTSHQVDFIDLELKGRVGAQVLRVFVDTDGGITLDQCVILSREISDALDRRDILPGRYRLEVSSPGLDRPLKSMRDFQRNLGRQVKIKYLDEGGNSVTVIGQIEGVDDDAVVILEDDQQKKITMSKILLAKILPVW
ncbi:MAG: ribosome maturation factor RimP [candidate division KSB1 bacterium]|nr:ribosome maturation factor RimP [candidate division KSB1 bacterium]MDZ7336167.1 ribosome maturation factor RimP [candidate division KSB1 bacterium]MDZ7357428.1 ribosome maturation factor RimP [candidate division KSB1 bacterium]MDZ7401674.1 ribosome maturation factor RimP [candidate division KSB1 bacterium]